ncbi:hypothetical protein [Hydrogenophaga electricum]|uniref:Uncharacterized protein n=1 Tax=Hydrogenophaga electricum TaxID=1230953 RepID=A0ABQ6C0Z4_9BURK|nr:hypothetical protein [Hydrogenophaga electricum]GLS13657.1 hypothetical protein GCM10007935_10870 [Hydrogenophaga electricum]
MRMSSKAVLHGIQTSKGEIDGRGFDSTKFHLSVDLGESSFGESLGVVTRPFKLGTSGEFDKWKHLKNSWPLTGIPVECDFDVVAGSDNTTKLTLLAIRPQAAQKAA